MTVDLAESIEESGAGLWRWSIWVESDLLEQIEEVVYTLDSSFVNPVRRTKERKAKFKIADVASGPFTIFARFKLFSGTDLKLQRSLRFAIDPSERSLPRVKPCILVVEDDVHVLEMVCQDLRRRYGVSFRLQRAISGQQGLEILKRLRDTGEELALVLSDQRMPEMQGTDFLSSVSRYFPFAKKALLTAYADADAAIKAINVCKIDYYLTKPWDPPEEKLYPVLDQILQTWQPTRGSHFVG
jgi:CheY-like chemotaxis protein